VKTNLAERERDFDSSDNRRSFWAIPHRWTYRKNI